MVGRAQGLTWWNSKAKGGALSWRKQRKIWQTQKKKVHCFCHIRTQTYTYNCQMAVLFSTSPNHTHIFFFTNTLVGFFRRDSKYSMFYNFCVFQYTWCKREKQTLTYVLDQKDISDRRVKFEKIKRRLSSQFALHKMERSRVVLATSVICSIYNSFFALEGCLFSWIWSTQ